MQTTLSFNIRVLRQSNHLSQTDLANALGVTKQTVSEWENNIVWPSITMLVSLAVHFSVSVDDLLGLGKQIESRRFWNRRE